ncbi:hypothetical protein T06_16119 [Trichinella sp. T6]|nr:hypothetical protein T06_16119 [Trichinella sp. T6]
MKKRNEENGRNSDAFSFNRMELLITSYLLAKALLTNKRNCCADCDTATTLLIIACMLGIAG